MTALTAERLARLRIWAERRSPDRPQDDDRKHGYYAFCPWCSSEGTVDADTGDEGNAHDVALELLDEIDRLRAQAHDDHASYGGAMADLDALVEVAQRAADEVLDLWESPLAMRQAVEPLATFLAKNHPPDTSGPKDDR